MSSKGLPGFLRRTRRRDFEESEDEDYFSSDDDESSPPSATAEKSNADESADKTQSNGSSSKSKGDEKEVLAEQGEEEEEFVAPIETETEVKTLEKARPSLNEHLPKAKTSSITSSAVEDSTSSLGMSSLGNPRPIKLSYRDSKFDSIIAAETIKMADLRMLGWNGIPVRRAAHWICAWFNLVLPSNDSCVPYSHRFFVSFFFGSVSIVVWHGKSCSVIFRPMPVDETVP
jgi:hypothetical protein